MTGRTFYKLQLVRFELGPDKVFPGTQSPQERERGDYYKANDGEVVEFFGYGSALGRATELNQNAAMRAKGWRYVPVEKGFEKQVALDV